MQIMRIFGLRDNAYCQVFAFIYICMYSYKLYIYPVWRRNFFLCCIKPVGRGLAPAVFGFFPEKICSVILKLSVLTDFTKNLYFI